MAFVLNPIQWADPGQQPYSVQDPGRWDAKFGIVPLWNETEALIFDKVTAPNFGQTFTCLSTLNVGQAVYVDAADDVALATSALGSGGPVIGFCAHKPTPTTCVIAQYIRIANLSGLVVDGVVYLQDNGSYAQTPGSTDIPLGIAIDTTTALLSAAPNPSQAGASGFSGFSGMGQSGYSGAGQSGTSGQSGISGQTGPIGNSGQSGYSGVAGSFAGIGQSGYSGTSGFSGTWSGASGISGVSGFSGALAGVQTQLVAQKPSVENHGFGYGGQNSYATGTDSNLQITLAPNTYYQIDTVMAFSGTYQYDTFYAQLNYTGTTQACEITGWPVYPSASVNNSPYLTAIAWNALPGNFNTSLNNNSNAMPYAVHVTGYIWTTAGGTLEWQWYNGQYSSYYVSVLKGSYLNATMGQGALSGYSGAQGVSGFSGTLSGASGISGTSGFSGMLTGVQIQQSAMVPVADQRGPGHPQPTTYLIDPYLQVPLLANTWYEVDMSIGYSSTYSGDYFYGEMAYTGTLTDWQLQSQTTTSAATSYGIIQATCTAGTTNPYIFANTTSSYGYPYVTRVKGWIQTGVTPGTFSLNWYNSQYSAYVMTILPYSYLNVTQGAGSLSGYSGTSGAAGSATYSGQSGVSGFSAQSPGPQGNSGTSGYSGIQGVQGNVGDSGTSGFSGIGTSGASGAPGGSGTSGMMGYSGTSGISAWSGRSGFSGSTGSTGDSGTSGFSGNNGSDGAVGPSGFSGVGIQGESGVSGASVSGQSGWSGQVGDQGTSGVSGFSALQGPAGTSGTSGTSGQQGNDGTSGFSGQVGASGFSGTYSGWSGTSGQQGIQGIQGYSGTSGFSGSAPTAYDCENFIISGSPITNAAVGEITIGYNARIVGIQMTSFQTGDITVDIWRSSFASYPPTQAGSITGSNLPAIVNSNKFQDLVLAGWITSLNQNDVLRFVVSNASCINVCTVSLLLART